MQNPKLTYYIQRNRKQKISRYIRINNENDTTYCTYRYDKNRERLTRLAIVDGEEVSNKTIEKTFSKKVLYNPTPNITAAILPIISSVLIKKRKP